MIYFLFEIHLVEKQRMLYSITKTKRESTTFPRIFICTFEQTYCLTVQCDINYKPYFKVEKLQTKREKNLLKNEFLEHLTCNKWGVSKE